MVWIKHSDKNTRCYCLCPSQKLRCVAIGRVSLTATNKGNFGMKATRFAPAALAAILATTAGKGGGDGITPPSTSTGSTTP